MTDDRLAIQDLVARYASAATGEVYCMAHHIYLRGDQHHDNVMAVRYLDTYERGAAGWLFTRREPVVVFSEDRPVRVG